MFLALFTADFIVLPETCYVFDMQMQDFISGRGDLGQLNFPEVREAHSKALNLRLTLLQFRDICLLYPLSSSPHL